MVRFSL